MEFLLLGPLEVRVDRERLALGGPRQRAVLADLLLHAGSVVSMDGLIDDLWGAEPPPTAEAVVQNAISRLRRTLGRDVIETRAPGYVLRADPGAVDARRFERLVHDARPLPASERSPALRDALALWRGPPFADLAFESFLQEEIARLDELRLTALEDRLEAEIELRNHDAVIADAHALSAQQPARERLCRLLMLALHRAGRQQDALDAYEATRRALDDLWGLEPSPETRALHLMILTQDPALAAVPEVQQTLGAVRRPVALLLVEIRLDEEMELEAASAALREARSVLAGVVARHGGSLSPESGVDLVAAFGAEGAHEDDVLRAARTAVELREILLGSELEARVAVGTGRLLVEDGRPVLVGAVVGQTRRALHDAGADEILLTPAATRLGGEALEFDPDGRLLGVKPGRPRATVESAPFVGRTLELDALREAFAHVVTTGQSRHVVVVGEAGIGKTRLVSEALDGIDAVVLEAACVPYGEGTTFLPLRELAERAAVLDPAAPKLGELSSADAAFAATRSLLEHFSASRPLVVVLDDMHWAAPALLDLVEFAVRVVTGPLLAVTVTRPELTEQRAEWRAEAVAVEQMSEDDARALITALPERQLLDEAVADAIVGNADGIPLFLEQLLSFAVETDLAAGAMPPTLETLLASRIDSLEPGERAVLERAAIAGRIVSRESIRALTPEREVRGLEARLASLERRRLVRLGVHDVEFVHALVRDAAYGAVRVSERAELHERLARWLDARGGPDEIVGYHLEHAATCRRATGDGSMPLEEEAAERLARAGERAVWGRDHAAAISLLSRAVELLPTKDIRRLELECLLSIPIKNRWEWRDALERLDDVTARARELGDRRLELRAGVEQVWPRFVAGQIDDAATMDLVTEAVRVCESEGDLLGQARALLTLATAESRIRRRFDAAVDAGRRAAECFARYGAPGVADSLIVDVMSDSSIPVAETVAFCRSRLDGAMASPSMQAAILRQLADQSRLVGEFEEAAALLEQAHSRWREIGEEVAIETVWRVSAAKLQLLLPDGREAERIAEAGLAAATAREDRVWRGHFLGLLAEAAVLSGLDERALDLTDQVRRTEVDTDLFHSLAWRFPRARALASVGRARAAQKLARETVAIVDETDSLLARGEARVVLADVLAVAGKRDAAAAADEGAALFEAKGATLLAERARARAAELRGEPGDRAPLKVT